MLYGIKEIWILRNGMLVPLNSGLTIVNGEPKRIARMYVNVDVFSVEYFPIKFIINIGGSHPNPSPHIRLTITNEFFNYNQSYYGNNVSTYQIVDNITTRIEVFPGGNHSESIEIINMPFPCEIGLVQNTISAHSTSNELLTYVDGKLLNSQRWSDDTLINVSMEPENYFSTPVLRIFKNNDDYSFEGLLPI